MLTSVRPVEGSGVAVGHPHEALAAQHGLDRAVPCPWGLALQGTVGGHWQPAQHHLSQSAVQHLEPINVKKLAAVYKQLRQAGHLMHKVLQMTENNKHAIDCCQKHCLPQSNVRYKLSQTETFVNTHAAYHQSDVRCDVAAKSITDLTVCITSVI